MPATQLKVYLDKDHIDRIKNHVAALHANGDWNDPKDWRGWICAVALVEIRRRLNPVEKASAR